METKRLTARRCSGIKEGYWSMARKDELVQRLGKFEDICEDPDELRRRMAELEDKIAELMDPETAQRCREAEQARAKAENSAAWVEMI